MCACPRDSVRKHGLCSAGKQLLSLFFREAHLFTYPLPKLVPPVLGSIARDLHDWKHQRLEIRDWHTPEPQMRRNFGELSKRGLYIFAHYLLVFFSVLWRSQDTGCA